MAWVRRYEGHRERRHSVEVTDVEMLESGWMSLEDPVLQPHSGPGGTCVFKTERN